MFCQNCGKEILDDSRFCMECGSLLHGAVHEDEAPAYSEEYVPAGDDFEKSAVGSRSANKKKKTGLIIGIVLGVLALLAVLIFLLKSGVGSKGKESKQDQIPSDSFVQDTEKEENEELSDLSDIIINTEEPVRVDVQPNVPEKPQEEQSDLIMEEPEKQDPVRQDPVQQEYYPMQESFYGIWCSSSTDESEMWELAEELRGNGYDASVVNTDDWSNLNNGWFSVTAGMYLTEEDAEYDLPYIQNIISDAYVKYSGEYQRR